MARRALRPAYQAACAGARGLPCLIGPHVPHAACEIMGPTPRMPRYIIDDIIARYLDSRTAREFAMRIRENMIATNDCLVHATAIVTGAKSCWCARCQPDDPRWPWSPFNPENRTEAP